MKHIFQPGCYQLLGNALTWGEDTGLTPFSEFEVSLAEQGTLPVVMRTPAEQLRDLEGGEIKTASPVTVCMVLAFSTGSKGKETSQLSCSYRFHVLYR
jgi:hypothetical protein